MERIEHLDDYRKSTPRQRLMWLTRAKTFVIQTMPRDKLEKWLESREKAGDCCRPGPPAAALRTSAFVLRQNRDYGGQAGGAGPTGREADSDPA